MFSRWRTFLPCSFLVSSTNLSGSHSGHRRTFDASHTLGATVFRMRACSRGLSFLVVFSEFWFSCFPSVLAVASVSVCLSVCLFVCLLVFLFGWLVVGFVCFLVCLSGCLSVSPLVFTLSPRGEGGGYSCCEGDMFHVPRASPLTFAALSALSHCLSWWGLQLLSFPPIF